MNHAVDYMIKVVNAEHVSGYKLDLTFSDGVRSIIDFSQWIERYPFFAPLKDAAYFQNFRLEGSTVCWENGADIAPETLHQIALQQSSPQLV